MTRNEWILVLNKAKALAEGENNNISAKMFGYLLEAMQSVSVSSRSSEEPTEEAEED